MAAAETPALAAAAETSPTTLLFQAAAAGDEAAVQEALQAGADVTWADAEGTSALMTGNYARGCRLCRPGTRGHLSPSLTHDPTRTHSLLIAIILCHSCGERPPVDRAQTVGSWGAVEPAGRQRLLCWGVCGYAPGRG